MEEIGTEVEAASITEVGENEQLMCEDCLHAGEKHAVVFDETHRVVGVACDECVTSDDRCQMREAL